MIRPRRRRRGCHEQCRVVLHREDDEPGARMWATAARSVLRELGIADWWRVGVEAADGGWLVAVDWRPAARRQPRHSSGSARHLLGGGRFSCLETPSCRFLPEG